MNLWLINIELKSNKLSRSYFVLENLCCCSDQAEIVNLEVSVYLFYLIYYIHDKITAIWLVNRSAIISLIALSRSAINNFRDASGEREVKTTKIQYGGEIYLV